MSNNAGRRGRPWRRLSAEVRSRRQPCHICYQPIDYTLDAQHPDSFTVDHVKSWRDHPELRTDPSNLVAAHRRCNSSKGTSAAVSGLGMTSRQW